MAIGPGNGGPDTSDPHSSGPGSPGPQASDPGNGGAVADRPDNACQGEVIDFLSAPAEDGATPRHLETHLSHLFLGGERALKLKKAISWSVVDYATLAARKHFCHREMAVNRPFAAPLYRGVRPIVRGLDGLRLGAPVEEGEAPAGDVLDYVVEMRRFPDGAQLDEMVEAGRATPALMDRVADAVAAMHRAAPVQRRRHRAKAEADLVAQLAGDVSGGLTDASLCAAVADWRAEAATVVDAAAGLIDRRGRHGFVRRCHGDLHLSNICVLDGQPMPFDAIEFSEDLATIDVAYDVAFLVADLALRGQHALAARAQSRYLEGTRDYAGLRLQPLYASLRMMVRALVATAKGRDPGPPIRRACEVLAHRPRPQLTAVAGLSGSGKSTVAQMLGARTGAVVIRSDVTRKRLHGVAPETPLPREAYAPDVTARVYRRMRADARRALGAGWPVILDATFLSAVERDGAEALGRAFGVPFIGVWLDVPLAERRRRVGMRGPDASDADAALVDAQDADEPGLIAWHWLDGLRTADALAAAIERQSIA